MRSILTSTALATVLAFGLAAGSTVVRAQDAQQPEMNQNQGNECIGENCPGAGGEGTRERRQQPEDTQMDRQTGEETTTPRKKRRMGTQQDDTDVKTRTGEETVTRKKRRVGVQKETDVDVDVDARVRSGDRRWRFDPDRHRRSKSKSASFRFYFNGWYYPEPYWQIYVAPGRISCREGRAIVSERFNRVRVVECRGGTYTYIGRRAGDTYRILLNSRSGRIVGRVAI